jgi:hypothetical protein
VTSPLIRGRPRRVTAHISVRVLHTLLGVLAGVVWLVLPGMTISTGVPVAVSPGGPVAGAVAQKEDEDETSAADLVLPLLAASAAIVLAGYGYVRRTRRARSRTTPGGMLVPPPEASIAQLDEQARASLVEADDCVRVSREELRFAEARFGGEAVAPFAQALRDAEAELAAAFRMRQRYDEGVPEGEAARRHALVGVVGRSQEAGRLLDAQAAGFDQLRGLEGGLGEALDVAEARFRELAGRTGAADATLTDLTKWYAPSVTVGVLGHVEQAKDRLVFATSRLNQARQTEDLGEAERAIRHLRSAEGAIAQAATLVDGIDRLAGDLATAAAMVPAALTGGEVEIAGAREAEGAVSPGEPGSVAGSYADVSPGGAAATVGRSPDESAGASAPPPAEPLEPLTATVPPGELHARITHADLALAAVREELTAGPYDPLDALRRIVGAVAPLVSGRAGVIPAGALLVARSAVGGAGDVVGTHRGAVGSAARIRLAEAERLLAPPPAAPAGRGPYQELADLLAADALARRARGLAEQDVRLHGNPMAGTAEHTSGLAGAVLGGILLGGEPNGGPPPSFGGPHTRARRRG